MPPGALAVGIARQHRPPLDHRHRNVAAFGAGNEALDHLNREERVVRRGHKHWPRCIGRPRDRLHAIGNAAPAGHDGNPAAVRQGGAKRVGFLTKDNDAVDRRNR